MAVELEIAPKTKRPIGEPCCVPLVHPEVGRDDAARLAPVAKALGDPTRLQLVDVMRRHAGKVCVCELQPLFAIKQSTLSEHLKSCVTPASWAWSAAASGPTTTSSLTNWNN